MFYSQLEELCIQNNIKITVLLQYLGKSKSSATSWKNGTLPSFETLLKISEYFNVSLDYLLTGKERRDLSYEESEWLNLYRQLTPEEQKHCLRFIKGYIEMGNSV